MTWIGHKTANNYIIVLLTLSILQLLRPTEAKPVSFASMPCWWCCSCSLWICSLIFRASWIAFITVSWSPNNAVELRLDRISVHTHSLDSKITSLEHTLSKVHTSVTQQCSGGTLTQRWTTAKAPSQWTGDTALAGQKVGTVFTAKEQVLYRGYGGLDRFCRLRPRRQVKWLCSFLLRKQRKEYERKQMWIDAAPLLPPFRGEAQFTQTAQISSVPS